MQSAGDPDVVEAHYAASLIPAEERPKIYDDVKRALGENYYTQHEKEGVPEEHVHMEYRGVA